jgi:uncharacterized RDD family membrane protein YckC
VSAVPNIAADPTALPFGTSAAATASLPDYAGFWRRFCAWFLDGIVLNAALVPIGLLLSTPSMTSILDEEFGSSAMEKMLGAYLRYALLCMIANWLYCALMESSARQATLGKTVLGIRVTDLDGKRLSFGRATGRFFGKIVSGLTLMIGYAVQLITERRQALHDVLAGTLVVRSGS